MNRNLRYMHISYYICKENLGVFLFLDIELV